MTARLMPPGEGRAYWFLGVLATIKAGGADTGGRLTVAEMEAPAGFRVPEHRHREEDELFYVLDGAVRFRCGDSAATVTRGGLAWLPRGEPHTFAVSDAGPARLFNVHTGALFEGMVEALGQPAPDLRVPDPPYVDPDPAAVARAFDAFGIDLVADSVHH